MLGDVWCGNILSLNVVEGLTPQFHLQSTTLVHPTRNTLAKVKCD